MTKVPLGESVVGIGVIIGYVVCIAFGIWKSAKAKPPVDPKYDPNWEIRRKSE